jgi:hypothetical protein
VREGTGETMTKHRIFTMPFSKVYPLYVKKAENKQRTQKEVDQIVCWLTGFSTAQLKQHLRKETDFETFFAQAKLNPKAPLITGVVCGVRVEDVADPLMRKVRMLDKLIDELAKGRTMEKILRKDIDSR